MADVPPEVREYLVAGDGLYRAQLVREHPDLPERLRNEQTRRDVFGWLQSVEVRGEPSGDLAAQLLNYLGAGARPEEAAVVRTFLVSTNPHLRLRAYEFLLRIYFPDHDREALLMLLHSMLLDSDDTIRAQGVRYLERSGLAAELDPLLRSWQEAARQRNWEHTESFQLVRQLLEGGP